MLCYAMLLILMLILICYAMLFMITHWNESSLPFFALIELLLNGGSVAHRFPLFSFSHEHIQISAVTLIFHSIVLLTHCSKEVG